MEILNRVTLGVLHITSLRTDGVALRHCAQLTCAVLADQSGKGDDPLLSPSKPTALRVVTQATQAPECKRDPATLIVTDKFSHATSLGHWTISCRSSDRVGYILLGYTDHVRRSVGFRHWACFGTILACQGLSLCLTVTPSVANVAGITKITKLSTAQS